MKQFIFNIAIFSILFSIILCKKPDEKEKPEWAKKDIRDYSDADMERLLDQWDEDEEPLEPDELPEHLRPQPPINFGALNDPESMLKASKKGRTLMSFVSVANADSREEAEEITKIWQTSLLNAHIQAERYMVDDDRAIFMFKDGAQAWEAKDYLIAQDRCKDVTIEQKVYDGKGKKTTETQTTKSSKSKVEL